MSENVKYAQYKFENYSLHKEASIYWKEDVALFRKKLGLDKECPRDIDELIEVFGRTNIRNVWYYKKRIKKETKIRDLYAIITAVIAAGMPIFIFLYTNNVISLSKNNLEGLEAFGSVLAALITSVLGMHQLISSWTEKRQYRALFHQAKVDLMQILFELEERIYVDMINPKGKIDVLQLEAELKNAVRMSREIVSNETRQYFEISSSPVVNLTDIFSSSSSAASELIGNFRSKRYSSKLDELKRAQVKQQERREQYRDELSLARIQRKSAIKKMKRLRSRFSYIEDEIDELELIGDNELTPIQEKRLLKLQDRKDELEAEIDSLSIEIDTLSDTIDAAEIALEDTDS